MQEEWRDIKCYESLCQVSNLGNVKSLDRLCFNGQGYFMRKGKILKPHEIPITDTYSTFQVGLVKNGKEKRFIVARLVAMAFPEICGEWFEGAVVNHKDENPRNNNATNLEWTTQKNNVSYGTANQRRSKTETNNKYWSKAVDCYTLEGDYVDTYPSASEAFRQTGIYNIGACCRGERNNAGNYIWRYSNRGE